MSEGLGRASVTIYDVAQRAGVSKSLVSLVLQGSPKVSDTRRRAVQQAIADLGYRPSRAAASLAGQRSKTIGVVIDDFANPWFVEMLAGLRAGLLRSDFHVSVADLSLNEHLRESPVQGFLSARVDGLVLAAEPDPGDVAGLAVPTVLLGARRLAVEGADRVGADEAGGGRAAVEHLRGLGHRQIAFVNGPSGPAELRAVGYREAMAGLEAVEVMAADTTDRGGYQAVRELLATGAGLTGVVCANDLMALGAWQALREAELAVPADVSLIGYDNSQLASTGLVQLTSVDPRNAEQGRLAAEALLARLAEPQRPAVRELVHPRLVSRSTVAPAR